MRLSQTLEPVCQAPFQSWKGAWLIYFQNYHHLFFFCFCCFVFNTSRNVCNNNSSRLFILPSTYFRNASISFLIFTIPIGEEAFWGCLTCLQRCYEITLFIYSYNQPLIKVLEIKSVAVAILGEVWKPLCFAKTSRIFLKVLILFTSFIKVSYKILNVWKIRFLLIFHLFMCIFIY